MQLAQRRAGRQTDQATERGQALVVFVLALTGRIPAVGLVLDGGDAFAQRRSEQNAADLAALAGANNYLVNGDEAAATTSAQAYAANNGYTNGVGGVTVSVSYDYTAGAKVTVTVQASHRNNFLGLIGQGSWSISASATAVSGLPDTAYGAAPMIFTIDSFLAPMFATNGPGPAADFFGGYSSGQGAVQTTADQGPGNIGWESKVS